METVSIKKQIVQKAFSEGCDDVKKVLKNLFGEDVVYSSDWMSLWNEFCKKYKLKLTLPYPFPQTEDEEYIDAQFMMMHIIRAKRKKKPDYNNSNEYKYKPIFDMGSSGFGFSNSAVVFWIASATCGSRLSIPDDRDLTCEIAKEYLPIYEKIMTEK